MRLYSVRCTKSRPASVALKERVGRCPDCLQIAVDNRLSNTALIIILLAIALLAILLIMGDDLRTFINDLLLTWFPSGPVIP